MSISHETKRYNINISPYYDKDLNILKDYLFDELKIESVPIFNKHDVKARDGGVKKVVALEKNSQPMNIHDRELLINPVQYVIAADDLAKINLELTHGRLPKADNEILIPKSKMEALLNNKCLHLGNVDDEAILKDIDNVDDIFNQEFGEIRIVGAFDDYLDLDDKFKNYLYSDDKELEFISILNSATQQVSDNYLTKCVIVSSEAINYYNSMMYSNHGMKNREVNIKTKVENVARGSENDIQLLPQNSYTDNLLASYDTLKSNEILVSNALINSLVNIENGERFKVGDKIKLSSFKAQYESEQFTDTEGFYKYKTTDNIVNNKEFIIAGTYKEFTSPLIVMSQDNFDIVTGGNKLQTTMLFMNHKDLKLSDITGINKFINKNISKVDIANYHTKFDYNNSDGLVDNMSTAITMKYIIAIALSLILFILIALFTYSTYSSSIKAKANEVLILRSLGATKLDICKIFFVHSIILCAIQLIVGIALGALVVWLLNYSAVNLLLQLNFSMFSFDAVALILVLVGVIAVNIATLFGGIWGMRDKNLRKAFQSAKL